MVAGWPTVARSAVVPLCGDGCVWRALWSRARCTLSCPTRRFTAGLGGLIPWQAGIETGIGRFQFILGREVGLTLYGRGKRKDAILVPIDDNETALVNLKSTQLDFPIVEYRPFRTFSLDQSSSLVLQMNFGIDIPHNESVVLPEGIETPKLRPVWYLGLRAAFDWRYYF